MDFKTNADTHRGTTHHVVSLCACLELKVTHCLRERMNEARDGDL